MDEISYGDTCVHFLISNNSDFKIFYNYVWL